MHEKLKPYRLTAGIDIGTSAIKLVLALARLGEPLKVVGAGHIPLDGLMMKGDLLEGRTEELGKLVQQALAAAERTASRGLGRVSEGDYRIGLAFSGSHVEGVTTTGIWPLANNRVGREDVFRALEFARCRALSLDPAKLDHHQFFCLARVDANKVLLDRIMAQAQDLSGDNKISSFSLPWIRSSAPQENAPARPPLLGRQLELDLHFILANQERLQAFLDPVQRQFRRQDLTPCFSGMASLLAVTTEKEQQDGVLVLDLGSSCTDYVLARQGNAWYSGVIPVGGLHLANDLRNAFDLEIAEAELLLRRLREFGSVGAPADDGWDRLLTAKDTGIPLRRNVPMRDVELVLCARLDEAFRLLAQRLSRSGAEVPAMIPAGIRLTGGLAKIPGISELVARHFGGVRTLALGPVGFAYADQPLERLTGDPSWSTALGLLRGLEIQKRGRFLAGHGSSYLDLFVDEVNTILSHFLRT